MSIQRSPTIQGESILKDFKKGATGCEVCGKKFSMFNGEHTCKRCFRKVCQDCAKNNLYIINYDKERNKKHKVCFICFKESDSQKKLKIDMNLIFAKDSKIAAKWFDLLQLDERDIEQRFIECNIISEKMKSSESYQGYLDSLNQFQRTLKENYKENYSFMEFYHYMTLEIADGEIIKTISNVLRAFLHVHCDTVGYNKDIFDLCVFLLMFLSPSKAWMVMCKIYQDIVPSDCYPINLSKSNFQLNGFAVNWICQILQDRFKIQTHLIPKVRQFIEIECLDYFSSFLMKKLNMQVTFFLVNNIFNARDKYSALVQAITCVIAINSNSINILGSSNHQTPRIILEQTQLEELTKMIAFDLERPDLEYFRFYKVIQVQAVPQPQPQQQIEFLQTQSVIIQPQVQSTSSTTSTTVVYKSMEEYERSKMATSNVGTQQLVRNNTSENLAKTDQTQQIVYLQQQLQQSSYRCSQLETQVHQHTSQIQLDAQEIQRLQNENQNQRQQITYNTYEIETLQKSSNMTSTSHLTGDLQILQENNNKLNSYNHELQEQIKLMDKQFKENDSIIQASLTQVTQEYQVLFQQNKQLQEAAHSTDSEAVKKLTLANFQLTEQIRLIQEQFKLKIQQDRALFQQEYEQSQDAFEQLEKNYINACMKVMLLTTRSMLDAKGKEEAAEVQVYAQNRKGTLGWQSELGILQVRLNNKEKECERLLKNQREVETKYELMVRRIKEEYEQISNQELRKVCHKFEIEKNYFEEEINQLRNKIIVLEASLSDFDSFKLEFERITFVCSQLKVQCSQFETRYNLRNDEMDELQRRFDQKQLEYQNQLEHTKNSSNQSLFDQKLKKFLSEIEYLKVCYEQEKVKCMELSNRYVVQCLELRRVNNLNQQFYTQNVLLCQNNEELNKQMKDLEHRLSAKDSQFQVLQQEMTSFQMFSSQVKGQDQTGKIGALEKQIHDQNEKIRRLIDENSQLKFDLENLRVQYNKSQENLEFANQQLSTIQTQYEQEISQIKEDYEKVIAYTVTSCNTKITSINLEWSKKYEAWKEKERNYKMSIELLEEKIAMLTIQITQYLQNIEQLEEKVAILSAELRQKTKYILELEEKMRELEIIIQSLNLKIEKLEEKLSTIIMELKMKSEMIIKLEHQILELKKQIELYVIRIEDLEEYCAKLSMQIQEKERHIVSLELEIRNLKILIDQYLIKIAQYEERIAYYELEMEKKRNAYMRITLLSMENKRLQKQNSGFILQINQLTIVISQRDAYILTLENKIAMLSMELKNLNFIIVERDNTINQLTIQINQLTIVIGERDAYILTLENKIAMLSMELKNLNFIIVERDNTINQLTIQINQLTFIIGERDNTINGLNGILAERDAYILILENKIAMLTMQIQQMSSSTLTMETEMTLMRTTYQNRLREALKRYVLNVTELRRQSVNVLNLIETIEARDGEINHWKLKYEEQLEFISDAQTELENLAANKKLLSKKNLDLTKMTSEFEELKQSNKKTMMRLIIVSMELERSLMSNGMLKSQMVVKSSGALSGFQQGESMVISSKSSLTTSASIAQNLTMSQNNQ